MFVGFNFFKSNEYTTNDRINFIFVKERLQLFARVTEHQS